MKIHPRLKFNFPEAAARQHPAALQNSGSTKIIQEKQKSKKKKEKKKRKKGS